MLGAPELNTALQVGSHESGVERKNPLPRPAGHASFDAAQDAIGFLGSLGLGATESRAESKLCKFNANC